MGFSCWAWDYDNDGWLDIFATTAIDYSVGDIVKGLNGEPHTRDIKPALAQREGQKFEDKTKEAGLDIVFADDGKQLRRLRQRRISWTSTWVRERRI